MASNPCDILLVDDDPLTRKNIGRLLCSKLHQRGFVISIEEAESQNAAMPLIEARVVKDDPYDVIVLDWLLNERDNGASLLKWVKERTPDTEVILLTGNPEPRLQERVLEMGAIFYADKKSVLHPEDRPRNHAIEEGALSGDSFALMIANCVERLRIRREQRKTLDLISQMHKDLTVWFDLDTQLNIVVTFPRRITSKIHKASIRMPHRSETPSPNGPELERVGYDGCHVCNTGDCTEPTDARIQKEGIVAHVYRTGRTYVRNQDIAHDPYYVATCPKTRSELCIPLKIREHVIGVLNMESPEEGTFTTAVVRDMEAVAEVASPSIRNARWLKMVLDMAGDIGTTVAKQVVGEGTDWLTALDSVRPELVEPICQRVLKGALKLTDANLGVVYMAERGRQVLRLAAEHGMGPASKQGSRQIRYAAEALDSEQAGVVAIVARDGTTRRTTGDPAIDGPLWRMYKPFLDPSANETRIKSFLCVPIELAGEVFGVIDLEDERPNKFTAIDEMVIEAFANMIATSLANPALTDVVKTRGRLKGRTEIYDMVAHDSKKPLQLLEVDLATALLDMEQGLHSQVQEAIQNSHKLVLQTLASISETLQMAKSEGEGVNLRPFDLMAMLRDVADELRPQFPRYRVDLDETLTNEWACANPLNVKLVFKELIKNAAEMAEKCDTLKNGDGRVFIDCQRNDRHVIIGVEDNGPGISEQDAKQIFELGFSTRGDSRGIGLTRARNIIRLQLGELTFIPTSTPGARFEVTLPTEI